MNSFEELELDPRILKGIGEAGFLRPFPIQERTVGPLLAGSDVIGQARTGTGKTAAFGLALLQVLKPENRNVQALVLAPTRELAIQITTEIRKLGMYTGTRIVTIYGGQSINVQFEALERGAQVVVGTPGRIIDHIKRGTLNLDFVRFVVLDEADTMLDMGFIDDVEFILETVPDRRQLSLFAATMPERIMELSEKYMRDPERILIDSDEPSVDELDQYYTVVEQEEKLSTVKQLLGREKSSSSIIFCRTKYGAYRLAKELNREQLNVVPLHGDLSQRQREHHMSLFRSGQASILVATDVASRGIDIRHVGCVINYEVPQNSLLYFHRVGRTARAGDKGKAYTLVSRSEFADFARIRRLTKAVIKPLKPEDEKHSFRYVPTARNESSEYAGFRSRDAYRYRRKRWYR